MGTKPANLVEPTEQDSINDADGSPTGEVSGEGDFGGDISVQDTLSDEDIVPEDGASNLASSRFESVHSIMLSPQGALVAGAKAFAQTGIFIGRDGNAYKFSVGDETNSVKWDGTTLIIKGILTAGQIHVPDQNTTANSFHVDADGNAWWGATQVDFDADNDNAVAFVLKDGVAKFQSITARSQTTIEDILIVGRITAGQDLTVGFAVRKGEGLAIESDGKMYPVRATGFDTSEDSDTKASSNTQATDGGRTPFVRISDTVMLRVVQLAATGLRVHRIVYDILGKTIQSIGISAPTTSSLSNASMDRLSDTKAIHVGENSTTDIFAQVFSDLDTGFNDNAELSVDTDANRPMVLAKDESTALLIYKEASTEDLKFRQLNISGTTVTNDGSGEKALFTAVSSVFPYDLKRFGETDFYCATFEDNSIQHAIVFDWDGTTMNAGTAVNVAMASDTQPVLVPLDDTRMAIVAHDEAVIITRGLTGGIGITVGTSITWTSTGGAFSAAAMLGEDSFLTFTDEGAGNGETKLIRIADDGVTLTNFATFGSTFVTSIDNRSNGVIKLSPDLFALCYDTNATTSEYRLISLANTVAQFAGIATAVITEDNSGIIILSSFTDDLAGNVAGEILYPDLDGAFTTIDYGTHKGILAMSAITGKVF